MIFFYFVLNLKQNIFYFQVFLEGGEGGDIYGFRNDKNLNMALLDQLFLDFFIVKIRFQLF